MTTIYTFALIAALLVAWALWHTTERPGDRDRVLSAVRRLTSEPGCDSRGVGARAIATASGVPYQRVVPMLWPMIEAGDLITEDDDSEETMTKRGGYPRPLYSIPAVKGLR